LGDSGKTGSAGCAATIPLIPCPRLAQNPYPWPSSVFAIQKSLAEFVLDFAVLRARDQPFLSMLRNLRKNELGWTRSQMKNRSGFIRSGSLIS
jgi:hypothetical protein